VARHGHVDQLWHELIEALAQHKIRWIEEEAYPDVGQSADLSAFAKYLPREITPSPHGVWLELQFSSPPYWTYYRATADSGTYSLSIRLGWDPSLSYQRNAKGGRWVFDPGDGREEIEIELGR
jgi:hypothetical protein